jgi:two-component system NtrC family sensor kinase
MPKRIIRLYRSLSFKIFLLLLLVTLVLFAIYSTLFSTTQNNIYEDTIGLSAYRASDIIKQSLYRLMLKNEREELFRTILIIGNEPGMENIRIYNKKGEIKFSTRSHETGTFVDMRAEAFYACNAANQQFQSLPIQKKRRVYHTADGKRIMGLINPIRNAPECYNSACHAHSPDQTILGVLDVQMSLAELDKAVADTRRIILTITIPLILLAAILFGILIYLTVYRPIRHLQSGTMRLAIGDLDYRIKMERKDEIGMLARSFNNMAENLKKAYNELKAWSAKLEKRVQAKTDELERMHRGMLQVEKMASLGKMAATVAHELNNPLAGIVTYAKLLRKRIQKQSVNGQDREKIEKELDLIRSESMRCGNIVRNLLAFARGSSTNFQPHSISEIIERAMGIVGHHIELAHIQAESRVEVENDKIVCDPDQLLQALVALLVNAVEAMGEGGNLLLSVENPGGNPERILIKIRDNGHGIPDHVKEKVFEPFFSTKQEQKGVGLGLAVVYGIVQLHKGKIWLESQIEKGTTFFIEIPINQPEEITN